VVKLVCSASLNRFGQEFLVSGSEQRLELSLEQEVRAAKHGTGVQVAADRVALSGEHEAAETFGEHIVSRSRADTPSGRRAT